MTSFHKSLAKAGAALLLLAGFIGSVQAAGTAAGTDINNSATLAYSVGGTPQSNICSSPSGNNTSTCTNTTFKVDNKINVLVTTSDNAAVSAVPGGIHTLTFVVSNTGNSPQDFVLSSKVDLTTGSTVTLGSPGTTYTDSFDVSSCTPYDTSNAVIPGSRIVNLLPDQTYTVKLSCTIPTTKTAGAALTNSDIAVVYLKAVAYIAGNGAIATESTTNVANQVDTVFADGAGSDDLARGGDYTARDAFKIQTATLLVTKTFITLCDPAGGAALAGPPSYDPKSIPGAYIRYTVHVANSASAPVSAFLTNLTDALDTTKVTFDTEYITGANSGANPGCSATTATSNPGTATSTGNSLLVTLAGGPARTSFTGGSKYLTSSVYAGGTVTIPWATVLPASDGTGYSSTAGELLPGQTVSVTFNVIIK